MVEYICTTCKKKFNHRGNFTKHLNKKTKCKKIANYKCEHCGNKFTRKSSLQYHVKNSCKEKNKELITMTREELKNIIKAEVNKEKAKTNNIKVEAKKEEDINNNIKAIEKKTINNNNNNNNNIINNDNRVITNNNITIVTNNINMVCYGKENLDYIPDEVIKKILNKGFLSVPTLVKYVHFNKDKPDQHNIYVPGYNSSNLLVYRNDRWEMVDATNEIEQLCDNKKYFLEEKYEELKQNLPMVISKKFKRFLDATEGETNESKKTNKTMQKEVKCILYNNRDMPKNTTKSIK